MKLPIPFLLYVVALGLFGLAGWTFYGMLPMWKEESRREASDRGSKQSITLMDRGRGQGVVNTNWVYSLQTVPWWSSFRDVNLIGKLPPPPPKPKGEDDPPPPPPVSMQPLEEIIEIVALVHDLHEAAPAEAGQATAQVDDSYAIVRYKPTAKVEPPEWWILENTAPTAAAAGGAALPGRDIAAAALRNGRGGPTSPQPQRGRGNAPSPTSSLMPTSGLAGREILQRVSVRDLDEKRVSRLWPEFSHIRLVRVADDARSAWFVRDVPPANPGEPAAEAKEEQLFKTSQNLSQDVARALAEMQGRSVDPSSGNNQAQAESQGNWIDVAETMREGNTFHIGRNDERRFQDNDDFFDRLDVDVYVSRSSTTRGLIVRNVDSKLAARFGIQAGEVLLEVNGQAVESKAKALQVGKKQYKRGVRTFVTKWLSNGSIVERTYQAPNK